jgi:hypothetical protein
MNTRLDSFPLRKRILKFEMIPQNLERSLFKLATVLHSCLIAPPLPLQTMLSSSPRTFHSGILHLGKEPPFNMQILDQPDSSKGVDITYQRTRENGMRFFPGKIVLDRGFL